MTRHPLRVRDYLDHMLVAIGRIERFTRNKRLGEFRSDELLQDGVVRNLEILGEAAKNVLAALPDADARFPNIPFAAIYGMRNQLSHGYFTIDLDVVWRVVERDVPQLRRLLEEAIAAWKETSE